MAAAGAAHPVAGEMWHSLTLAATPRAMDPDDGRRSLWRLSEAGEALVAATVPIAEQITEKTLEPLSKSERSTFLALLRKLA